MTTKHTPGPWQCNPANGHVSTASEPSLHLGIVHTPEALGRDRFDARASNARLIAAAPDLLDALLFARHVMEGNGLHRSTDWPSGYPALWSTINVAIARATGGGA